MVDSPHISKLIEQLQGADVPRAGEMHAADIAQVLPELGERPQLLILSLLGDAKAAEVLVETDEPTREELLQLVSPERLVRMLNEMDPDDAADMLELAPEEIRPRLIAGLEEDQRRSVRVLGEYQPESAGGIMTTEVVAVGSNESARSALVKVRAAEQAEAISSLYVIDPAGTLVGLVLLKDLLDADPEISVGELMTPDVISVPAEADQEEAARRVEHYRLSSIPVVDAASRLLGVITLDDIIEVVGEEADEDVLRLAGTSAVHPTKQPILRRFLARSPWLAITLTGTFAASLLLQYIERNWFGALLNVVPGNFKALMYFIPMIGGMAGNVGSQSSATMVRGFATGEVDPERPMRVLRAELILGLMIGVTAGLMIGAIVAGLHVEQRWLGLVVGVALPCAITMAALSGTLIPFLCARIKVDPAYASGPFLQTMNDLTGYAIYFAVAVGLMRMLGVG
jgi:magnesium transporter